MSGKSRKRRRRGSALMLAGTMLIAAAFVVAWLNIQEDKRAGEASREILMQMQQTLALPAAPADSPVPTDEVAVLAVEPDFIRHPEMEMPVTEIDGREYVGVLDIPRLERSLPVMSSWSYPKLKIAPCVYTGSIYSRDMVISAHNYEEHLRYLWQLEPGDEVRFTDVSGNVFVYEVTLQEILAPYEVDRMTTRSNWDLTLFTCKTGGRMRITTRCVLLSYTAADAQQAE